MTVAGTVVGQLEHPGLLVLLGVTHDDTPADSAWMAAKIWGLRLLREERSLSDLAEAGQPARVLVVSQFTLYGDARRAVARPGPQLRPGRSPSPCTTGSALSSPTWAAR